MADEEQRYARGVARLKEVNAAAYESLIESLKDIAPDLGRYVVEFAFGDIYSRPGLDLKTRQVATLAGLVALGYAVPQLKSHINGALNIGWSRHEVIEIIIHMAPYAGFPAVLNAINAAKEVFRERDKTGA